MTKTDELFDEAISLPIEERTLLVDKLLHSLNPGQSEIDNLRAEEAERRVEEITKGSVRTIPGEEVFDKLPERLGS
jgi:putative addiction module component (TIGR02574 family)